MSGGQRWRKPNTIFYFGHDGGTIQRLSRAIRPTQTREVGVGYPNILISGSPHTHFASALHETTSSEPEVSFVDPDANYVNEFNRRTVRKSDSIVEMNLLYSEDTAPYTFSPVDDEPTLPRLVGEDGHQATLLNFGCHPVTGCSPEGDYYRFSADYIYYARQTISRVWQCSVLCALAAAGDAVSLNRRGDCQQWIRTS